jgi:hypothetical protein
MCVCSIVSNSAIYHGHSPNCYCVGQGIATTFIRRGITFRSIAHATLNQSFFLTNHLPGDRNDRSGCADNYGRGFSEKRVGFAAE